MTDLKKETAKMIAAASQNIAKLVAGESFEFWQRKDFRLYIEFEKLSQTEQDRIFNELEVSVLGLFLLQLDYARKTAIEEEKRVVFGAFRQDLPAGFLQIMIDLGIEKKYVDIWSKLIEMRTKEYIEDFDIALKESAKMPELKNEASLRIVWARIETITIDCLTHIRRGNVKTDDTLWKLLRKWFITLDTKVSPMTTL